MPQPAPTTEQARAFGLRLRRLRLDLGLSQEKIADAAGITLQHLSLLENGYSDGSRRSPANPRVGVVQGLARALRTDVYFIIEPLSAPDSDDDAPL